MEVHLRYEPLRGKRLGPKGGPLVAHLAAFHDAERATRAPESQQALRVPFPGLRRGVDLLADHDENAPAGRVGVGRQGADREQQRIPRQERQDDQAGLAEDDGEQHGVEPAAQGRRPGVEVAVEMQEEIENAPPVHPAQSRGSREKKTEGRRTFRRPSVAPSGGGWSYLLDDATSTAACISMCWPICRATRSAGQGASVSVTAVDTMFTTWLTVFEFTVL